MAGQTGKISDMPAAVDASKPSIPDAEAARRRRLIKRVSMVMRVLIPSIIAVFVWRELVRTDWTAAWREAVTSDRRAVLAGMVVSVLAVGMMGAYDWISFRGVGRLRGPRLWGLGSILFAWTNFLTIGPFGGPAARLIIYGRAGATNAMIIAGMIRLYLGMLGGLIGWLIACFAPLPDSLNTFIIRAGMAVVLSSVLAVGTGHALRVFKGIRTDTSARRLAALGFIGALDWGGVLAAFVLCGAAVGQGAGVVEQARGMFLGHLAGMMSMIPGGLGSADAVWLKTLTIAEDDSETAAAQIMLFRMVYYIVPWSIAAGAIAVIFADRWTRRGRASE